jgi:hypothetical protein
MTKMTMRPHLAALLLCIATAAHAQQSSWQGEWGPSDDSASRLTLSDCTSTACSFTLQHDNSAGQRCSTSEHQSLTLTSPTEATSTLTSFGAAKSCILHLHRAASTIAITQSGSDCNYWCAGTADFNTTLTQRSTTVYTGAHSDECLHHAGPARMATCIDPALSTLEQKWNDLYDEFPLIPATKDVPTYKQIENADAKIISDCNPTPNPAACVHDHLTADIAAMAVSQQAFIASYTDRGDEATASALATKIAGRYRHSFANGDVQGDHYRSTDTLTITRVGRASISFDAQLNFYNGHECGLSGGALYRKDGAFVFDDDPKNALPDEPVCHLAIKPTAKGIEFQDLTGGCKIYCGARGSWDGEAFTFNERVPAHPAPKPTQK